MPTFKERGNVAELVRRLDLALQGVAWEAIFVDDNSPDGTAAAVKEIAAHDPRMRCLRRVGRRGLAGACIEGMLSSAAPYVAVIDADLQHDEKVLPPCWPGCRRRGRSGGGHPLRRGRLGRQLFGKPRRDFAAGDQADPQAGRHAAVRSHVRLFHDAPRPFDEIAPRLSPAGFKILLDIAATAGARLRIAEQPYSSANASTARANSTSRSGSNSWACCWPR